MSYLEALERLAALRRFGVRPSLDGIVRALGALGDPHRSLQVVHIGGTNGKGSTAAFTAALLGAANCRTGLYTSPHLSRFTERIRVDGAEVSGEEIAGQLARLADLDLTFFEAATAVAFALFAERKVDVAVVEVGLGGRWDSTNVIERPLCTVVTGVALDHVEVLGGTLAAIAREKAGIWKPGVPAVAACKDDSARAILVEEAARVGAPLSLLGRDFSPYGGPLAMAGAHQADNAALAWAAVERCPPRFRASRDAQAAALAGARWPGRLEWLAPDVLVDAAHNPDGAAALARALPPLAAGRRVHLVAGVVDDKDAAGILGPLVPLAARVILTRPPSPRALDPARLAALVPGAQTAATLGEALPLARAPNVLTVVCGSIFLVGEARRILLGEPGDPIAAHDPAARAPSV